MSENSISIDSFRNVGFPGSISCCHTKSCFYFLSLFSSSPSLFYFKLCRGSVSICLFIRTANKTSFFLYYYFCVDYCDFCKCSFPDNVTNRQKHNNGTVHKSNRQIHYDWFKGNKKIVTTRKNIILPR